MEHVRIVKIIIGCKDPELINGEVDNVVQMNAMIYKSLSKMVNVKSVQIGHGQMVHLIKFVLLFHAGQMKNNLSMENVKHAQLDG